MRDESTNKFKKTPSSRDSGFDEEGSFFNRVRSDALKRKVESMLKDGVIKNLVSELKMPRELVTHLMSQIDDTKQAALGVITREVRLFFENTNLSDELARLLSQLSFEVSTKVRFVRNENGRETEIAGSGRTKRIPEDKNTPESASAPMGDRRRSDSVEAEESKANRNGTDSNVSNDRQDRTP